MISDTHGLLRPGVLNILGTCDYILHARDIDKPKMLDKLREIAPLYVVKGNNDKEWAEGLPTSITFAIEQVNFFMVHNKKEIPKNLENIHIVVFGHSHKYCQRRQDDCLWLNPGSCGKRHFDQEITLATISIDGSDFTLEKINLQPECYIIRGRILKQRNPI